MPHSIVLDEDGLLVYSYKQLDETVKYAYKVYTDETKTKLLRHPTGFDTPEEATTDMYVYLQSLETILFDEDGVEIYSYVTMGGQTKYGNRVYEDSSKEYVCHGASGYNNYEDAENEAKSFLKETEKKNAND